MYHLLHVTFFLSLATLASSVPLIQFTKHDFGEIDENDVNYIELEVIRTGKIEETVAVVIEVKFTKLLFSNLKCSS